MIVTWLLHFFLCRYPTLKETRVEDPAVPHRMQGGDFLQWLPQKTAATIMIKAYFMLAMAWFQDPGSPKVSQGLQKQGPGCGSADQGACLLIDSSCFVGFLFFPELFSVFLLLLVGCRLTSTLPSLGFSEHLPVSLITLTVKSFYFIARFLTAKSTTMWNKLKFLWKSLLSC